MRFQIARNRRLYAEAMPGIGLLDASGRFAIAAAAELYRGILDDIEAHDAWFQDTVAGVFDRGGSEGVDAFLFHFYINMNDEHLIGLTAVIEGGKPVNEVMVGAPPPQAGTPTLTVTRAWLVTPPQTPWST